MLFRSHRFRDLGFNNNYIDNFSDLAVDVNGDGFPDIVSCSWFDKKLVWWKNPGRAAGVALWKEAPINACCNIEFATLADMDNDGKALEIVAQENGTGQSWYEAKGGTWIRHVVSDKSYGHGIGYGDGRRVRGSRGSARSGRCHGARRRSSPARPSRARRGTRRSPSRA